MLFTTTAHPTALAEAGTSYSHIAVNRGNNFMELEMNNAVEILFPLRYPLEVVGWYLWYPKSHLAPQRTDI
jgi:hypothetical protein